MKEFGNPLHRSPTYFSKFPHTTLFLCKYARPLPHQLQDRRTCKFPHVSLELWLRPGLFGVCGGAMSKNSPQGHSGTIVITSAQWGRIEGACGFSFSPLLQADIVRASEAYILAERSGRTGDRTIKLRRDFSRSCSLTIPQFRMRASMPTI